MYTYNGESKRIEFEGSSLSGSEVLMHLNSMYSGIHELAEAWGLVSRGVAVMEGVFLQDDYDDVDESVVDDPTEIEGADE